MEPDLTPVAYPSRTLSRGALLLFFMLTALESLGGAAYLLRIPADPKNAVFLGYSISRWVGVFIFGLLFFGSASQAVSAFRDRSFLRVDVLWDSPAKIKFLLAITCAAAVVSGSVLLLPGYRAGRYAALLVRLGPFLLWAFVVSLQIIQWIILSKYLEPRRLLQEKRSPWMSGQRTVILPVSILAAGWALIAFTKLGLKPDTMFWNGSAVPLLLWQVLAGLGIGLLFYRWEQRYRPQHDDPLTTRHKMLDPVIYLTLWLSAVLIWQLVPQQDSYFAPGAYPPNSEFYPYSDAATYDLSAELAVVGQGLSEQDYVDKPFYSWILFMLHRLSGDRFGLFLFFHIALIAAVIPVMYGIGRVIHSKAAGVAIAVVILLYETNAITATPWINSPNAKLLLTEPACRLGLALFALWFIQAYRDPARRNFFLAAAGGALGLTTMIRYNAWFILPAAMIWILLTLKKNRKRALVNLTIFVVAFLLPLLPWMARTSQTWVTPYFFVTRFRGTVWTERYAPDIQESEALPNFAFPSPLQPTASAPIAPTDRPVPLAMNEPVAESSANTAGSQYNNPATAIVALSSRHFLHNLVTSVLGLPESLWLDDIEHTIRIPNSHWLPGWDQRLNLRQNIFLAINLLLIGVGIGLSVKDRKPGGWVLLIVYLTYNFGLAFARTSGGRYLVPIEWIPTLYYLMGFFAIFFPEIKIVTGQLIFNADAQLTGAHPKPEWKSVGLVLLCVLLIGLAVPLSDRIIPAQSVSETLTELEIVLGQEFESAQSLKIDTALEGFLEGENAVMLTGKGLYPRYYRSGEGEAGVQVNTQTMMFPRLTFTLIGDAYQLDVLLPTEEVPNYFPHGSTVTVIGCDGDDYVDAIAVIVETEKETKLYRRTTINRFKCPLAEPDNTLK